MKTGNVKYSIKLVSEKHPHHGYHSGYDILERYLGVPVHHPASERPLLSLLFRLIPPRLVNRIVIRGGVQYYWKPRLFDEVCLMAEWMLQGKRIYHFLYGENGYRYLGLMKQFKRNRIICTFHLPPTKFLDIYSVTRHLKRLDGIIVLASHMVDFFSRFVPRERIFFVPHGVDTDFFCPHKSAPDPADMPFCLFVGQYLRDFQTLKSVIERINDQNRGIRFVLVTPPEKHGLFDGLRNIELLSGVSEEQLRDLYRNAALLLMPLEDAVANNAIMEAMACGLPIVTNDTGGIRDYVDTEFALLRAKGDSSAMAEATLSLCADTPRRARMQEAARAQALKFDWKIIADHIAQVYERVAGF